MSQGGAAYFCGKGIDNKDQNASIMGAVAGANYIRSVASVYGIPVVLHTGGVLRISNMEERTADKVISSY